MNKEISDIEKAALSLSIEDRTYLVRKLIAGLDEEEDQNVEQLWLDEVERRLADYDSGKTTARPAEEVFAKLKKKLS